MLCSGSQKIAVKVWARTHSLLSLGFSSECTRFLAELSSWGHRTEVPVSWLATISSYWLPILAHVASPRPSHSRASSSSRPTRGSLWLRKGLSFPFKDFHLIKSGPPKISSLFITQNQLIWNHKYVCKIPLPLSYSIGKPWVLRLMIFTAPSNYWD